MTLTSPAVHSAVTAVASTSSRTVGSWNVRTLDRRTQSPTHVTTSSGSRRTKSTRSTWRNSTSVRRNRASNSPNLNRSIIVTRSSTMESTTSRTVNRRSTVKHVTRVNSSSRDGTRASRTTVPTRSWHVRVSGVVPNSSITSSTCTWISTRCRVTSQELSPLTSARRSVQSHAHFQTSRRYVTPSRLLVWVLSFRPVNGPSSPRRTVPSKSSRSVSASHSTRR
mmetsp:Transcript_18170/g.43924  ORF Transcript_18170/g.43924 Transcript_18170/m.43924 type:complete len:223 (+) Transcript_18170:979-1647(+)